LARESDDPHKNKVQHSTKKKKAAGTPLLRNTLARESDDPHE
jgi:hypothetical protein